MGKRTRLPPATYVQSVVEWRFPKAHRYWDDCGKLIAQIEGAFSGLVCQGLEKDGFKFQGRSRGITNAMFYWERASILQAGKVDRSLAEAVQPFWSIIQEGLTPGPVTRIGQRTWLIYEAMSVDEAIRMLSGRSLWHFEEGAASSLGIAQNNGIVLRTVIEPSGRRMRLEVGTGSVTIQSKERTGILVDVDLVIEHPAPIPTDYRTFTESNLRLLRETIQRVFE